MRILVCSLIAVCSLSAFAIPGHVTKPIVISDKAGLVSADVGGGVVMGPGHITRSEGPGGTRPTEPALIRVHNVTNEVEVQVDGQWRALEAVSYQDARLRDVQELDEKPIVGRADQSNGPIIFPISDIGTSMALVQKADWRVTGTPIDRIQYYPGYGYQGYQFAPQNPCYDPCSACTGCQTVAPYYVVPAQPNVYALPPAYYPDVYSGYARPTYVRPYRVYRQNPYTVYRYPRAIRRW